MNAYSLERDEMGPLEFNGSLLATVSTERYDKPHWTELAVYQVQAQESDVLWVVHSVGQTRVDGQRTRFHATTCRTPEEVGETLMKIDARRGEKRLFGPGYDVLDLAAEHDSALDEWLDEYVMRTKETIR